MDTSDSVETWVMFIFYNNHIYHYHTSMYSQPWALLGFGLTLTYNGERGRQNKMLSYWFYPVHLLILGILRLYLGI